MTIKPRVKRFRIRRSEPPKGSAEPSAPEATVGAAPAAASPAAPAPQDPPDTPLPGEDAEIRAIRAEGLTGRQLRLARRVAQKHGIDVASDFEAIRQLRQRGIDPFQRANILDLVVSDGRGDGGAPPSSIQTAGGPVPNLPQTYRASPTPSPELRPPQPSEHDEVRQIQRDIARRRQRRMLLLGARLSVFVLLPTFLVAFYYYFVATPLFSTQSEFVIQQAETQTGVGGMAGLFSGTALATSQDSVTVQSYLQSRDAMRRLDADLDFRAHFSAPGIDPLLRLESDATTEAVYRLYRRMVQIGYDPSEGIIRMEVRATDPETSTAFSQALISYAEAQVDQLTQRLRADQMQGARDSYEDAEAKMQAAQSRVVDLQERYEVLSSEVEVSLLTTQISTLDAELTRERLNLMELMANPSPNRARVEPMERRIANLEAEIASLRSRLTQTSADGLSLARITGELLMAEADVQTRQLMLAQSLQQLEAARIEANRQVRYLSMGVTPVPPDEPSHPRAFENSVLALLIFSGIYLMLSMTASILREQVSA